MKKSVKRPRSTLGTFIIYRHKLEAANLGPEWERVGRGSDLDVIEANLEHQRQSLKPKQECELYAYRDDGGDFPPYDKPKTEPDAHWLVFVNAHNSVVVERLE
jgi:hypothetical protein